MLRSKRISKSSVLCICAAISVVVAIWSTTSLIVNAKQRTVSQLAHNSLNDLHARFDEQLVKAANLVTKIATAKSTKQYLKGEASVNGLQASWLSAAASYRYLDQIRYINSKGEHIRIITDGNSFFAVPQYIIAHDREDNSGRNLDRMDVEKIYMSSMVFEKGRAQVEKRYEAAFSLSKKVWDDRTKDFGLIIVSFNADAMLRGLSSHSQPFEFFLANNENRWFISTETQEVNLPVMRSALSDAERNAVSSSEAGDPLLNFIHHGDDENYFIATSYLKKTAHKDVVPASDFPWILLAKVEKNAFDRLFIETIHLGFLTLCIGSTFVFLSMLLWMYIELRGRKSELKTTIESNEDELKHLSTLYSVIDEGLLLVDAHARIVFANAAAHRILSNENQSMVNKSIHDALPSHVVLTFFQREIWRTGECEVSMPVAQNNTKKSDSPEDGTFTSLVKNESIHSKTFEKEKAKKRNLSVINFESSYVGKYFCIRCKDVTAKLELESLLNFHKKYDLITRTLTRQSLEAHMANAFMEDDIKGSVLYIDVDDFRAFNEQKGYAVGDKVLYEVAKRLKAIARKAGAVARIGADEFVIFSHANTRASCAKSMANQILNAVKEPLKIDEQVFTVNTSIGISLAPHDGDSPSQLLRAAEKAMQKVKRKGGAQLELYSENDSIADSRFLELGKEIREAIKKDEFVVYFQPIFNLKRRALKGFEALLRWEHKERGLLPPSYFLEHLENSRMIVDVGADILRKSMRFVAKINQGLSSPLFVSVNLSPRQFASKDLVPTLRSILQETECRAEWLELEIPETALLRDVDGAAQIVKELHSLGVKIAIDDFGTGYSSLDYLKKLHVDQLKIDKSFVSNAQVHNEDKAILEFTTFLAKKLELSVVAEGVEVAETDKLLQELGVETGQGYFYARPMAESKAEQFVSMHSEIHRSAQVNKHMLGDAEKMKKVVKFPARETGGA